MYCLEEYECSHYLHIWNAVVHQFCTESHCRKQPWCSEEKSRAHYCSEKEVEQHRHSSHLHHTTSLPCPDILRTKHGCTHIDDLEYEQSERHQLIDHSHCSNRIVIILAEHEYVDIAHYGNEQGLNEYRHRKPRKVTFQIYQSHLSFFYLFTLYIIRYMGLSAI